MAHNLNFNNRTGKYSFFSVKEKAWHGLGQIAGLPDKCRSNQTRRTGLRSRKSPLFTKGSGIVQISDGIVIQDTEIEVPNYLPISARITIPYSV
jgi:hypothetical protein